jgi:hypothetical protein
MTEKLPFLRERHRSSNWTRRDEWKRVKSTLSSLYNMTREKLLVLHKTLTELWISSSYKSVTHLLQCLFYSYRSQKVNFSSVWTTVTWTESLRRIITSFIDIWDSAEHQQAQWYIKLNVIAAFHKIWIAAEDKWKTAFCMRYRLYEWMMTSFELVNVSSTFQRYINWVLQNFLNEFCSVYVNDILIFTDELHQHEIMYKDTTMTLRSWLTNWHWQMWVWSQVNQVSRVHSESEKSIQMNSQKMKAIMNWQALNQ